MAGFLTGPQRLWAYLSYHRHIIWALLMREISTRYGRDNLGYLWLLIEPALFGTGVSILYSMIRPPIEYGLTVIEFTLTGYMPMVMFRQAVGFSAAATRNNSSLLYHRQITPLHLFLSRFLTEFCGVSLSYIVLIFAGHFVGVMPYPKDMLLLCIGWGLISLQAFGAAMFMNAISEMVESVERIIPILTYLFLPLSGFLFMVYGMPPRIAKIILFLPFVHCFELMRRGYFGEFLPTTYDIGYAFWWGVGMVLFGLSLQQYIRPRVEVV